jgi:ribosomal protein S18 acetylase RimI-like enzyme
MTEIASGIRIRHLDEMDISDIVAIDEAISGRYRPEVWERQISYYLRRAPEASLVAEVDGKVAGFMLGEVRSGEFGLEEPTGWIEVLGVDPEQRGKALGRKMAEAIVEYFKSQGAHSVRTLVDEERDDIRSFFSSLGFEASTLRPFVKSL